MERNTIIEKKLKKEGEKRGKEKQIGSERDGKI
jgi:hypothetical protein